MKKLLLLLFFWAFALQGECQRKDREHNNPEVVRCSYLQEDIYRSYANKPGCHGCTERYRECFFCGCPIGEHTTKVKKKCCNVRLR